MPNIDGNFLKYGVTRDDLAVIEKLCEEKGIPYDMIQKLLETYQSKRNDEETMRENAFDRIVRQAINQNNQ